MDIIQGLYERIEKANLWEKQLVLKRKQFVKLGGAKDTNLYYIVSGSLKAYIIHENEEHIIRFGYKNNIIADLESFITEKPSELYLQCLKKTELKLISKSKYMEFIKGNEENRSLWDLLLEQLVLQQIEREKDILIRSPKERYERVRKRSPQLFQEIPNKYIASYLRMTPETLSRLKKS